MLIVVPLLLKRGKIGTKTAIEIGQMVKKIVSAAAVVFLAFGCSRSGSKVQRNQQQYQTVQEGSASGVTSTINAPGETTPPMSFFAMMFLPRILHRKNLTEILFPLVADNERSVEPNSFCDFVHRVAQPLHQ